MYTLPYGDTGLIVRLFTEQFGIRAFLVQGIGSPKGQRKRACLQPLNRLRIRFHQRDLHEIQRLGDMEFTAVYQYLPYDPVLLALALTGVETLQQSVREEGVPAQDAFQLADNFLVSLDSQEPHRIHRLIWFLIHLTGALGYLPDTAGLGPGQRVFLHIPEGQFMPDLLERPEHQAFLEFVLHNAESCHTISLTNAVKRQLLDLVFEYYRYHVEGFQLPRSLQVFREVLA